MKSKKKAPKTSSVPTASFAAVCAHCDHYHEKGKCCFCEKDYYDVERKSREQHLDELGSLEDLI